HTARQQPPAVALQVARGPELRMRAGEHMPAGRLRQVRDLVIGPAPAVRTMKALVLAAGEGTRLRPLTNELPKPMVLVAGRPLISYALAWLRSGGVSEVAVNLHHKPEVLRKYLGDGKTH